MGKIKIDDKIRMLEINLFNIDAVNARYREAFKQFREEWAEKFDIAVKADLAAAKNAIKPNK